MLINLQATLILSLLSCLVSAFSTRFLIEGMDEEGKTPMEKVVKMTKMQKNESVENKDKYQGIEMEVIPIVTDVFSQPEDLFNMTPLKLVAAISAQHLITTVKNIPVAGNSYEDSLGMLENVVREFNKTAEIIKLTAMYVNISGHYMLSTLKEFTEESCDVKSLDDDLKSIRGSFLKTITDHAVGAIEELNKKTRHREISGSDILISSSYHIVSAFQEMTNNVMTLAEESRKKCKEAPKIDVTPPKDEKNNASQQKTDNIFSFQPIPQQGKQHKSIKKDQAQPITEEKFTQTKLNKLQYDTLEDFNNQDLTVEFYSPETIAKARNTHLLDQNGGRNQLKVPEDVTLEYIPLNKLLQQKRFVNGILTKTTNIAPKIKKIENFQDATLKNSNNQDLTVEVYSPGHTNIGQLLNEKDNINEHKDLKMEIIPLRPNNFFMFNPKNGLSSEIPKRKYHQQPSTIDNIEIFQDKKPDNVNKHQFSVEILSPETISSNQKDGIGKLKGTENNKPMENNGPKKLSLFQNYKNGILFDTPKEYPTVKKTIQNVDRELDSSAVDSLSNVPWPSSEMETTGINNNKGRFVNENLPTSKSIMNIFNLLKDPYQNQNMNKPHCNGQMEPVCGFDENTKKLIIFLNDCKREAHNQIYQTNYSSVSMENCVSLFLRSPAIHGPLDALHRSLDLRPR